MKNDTPLLWTSVGRKLFTGLFGLLLVGFVVVHLIGNLTLFFGLEALNDYAHALQSALHGLALPVAEVSLAGLFLVHIASALAVTGQNKAARAQGYARAGDAGGASRKSLASRSMVVTGLVLALFVVVHVAQFRLGVGASEQYYLPRGSTEPIRNVYKVVVDTFKNPLWVVFYCASTALLGLHLRHGFWSAFQTLGALQPRWREPLQLVGSVLAVVLAVGFFILPIYVYLAVDPASAIAPGGTLK